MAREVFGTPWIKLEVIGEADTLQPDVFGSGVAHSVRRGVLEVFHTPPRTLSWRRSCWRPGAGC